jgi:hypothetical protein
MALWGKCRSCGEKEERIRELEKENYRLLAKEHLKSLVKVEKQEKPAESGGLGFGTGLALGMLMSGGEATAAPVVEEDRSVGGEFGGAGVSSSFESCGGSGSSSSCSCSSGEV